MIGRLGNPQYNHSNKLELQKKNNLPKSNLSINELKTNSITNAGKNISFGSGLGMPIVNGVIGFITWMENGGKAVEFVVTDCLAMIFPRTFLAYNRNSKELGHPNVKAGTEEALREFLTGPSMFLVPLAFVGLGTKIFGEASSIGFDRLKKFGETFTGLAQKNVDKKEFYTKLLNEAIGDKVSSEGLTKSINEITKHITEIETNSGKIAQSKEGRHLGHSAILFLDKKIVSTMDFLANKIPALDGTRKALKQALGGNIKILENKTNLDGEIKKSFDAITKIITTINSESAKAAETIGHIISPDHISLKKAGTDSAKMFSISAKELVTDMMKFSKDVIAKTSHFTKESQGKVAEKLFNQRYGGRVITIATAIISTASFMTCIPLLYQRNKEYPGSDGLSKKNDAPATKIVNNQLLNIYNSAKGGKA